jgi:1-acyl-sn-glycerol-3-phosphate acyltransferase
MFNFIIKPLIGILSLIIFISWTAILSIAVYPIALFKILSFRQSWRDCARNMMNGIAKAWCGCYHLLITYFLRVKVEVNGLDQLKKEHWHVVISNHISAVDVLILTKIFNRFAPPRFFMKAALVWLPMVGPACWVMDFPLLKRYSKTKLAKNPTLRGKDLKQLKRNCRKFRRKPLSLMLYPEGTRYTTAKANQQHSPFKHLLKPRAGGVAMAIKMMHEKLDNIIDVTITYPNGPHKFWQFMCGKTKLIIVNLKQLPITPDLIGDYQHDKKFREHMQNYVNELWVEKDKLLTQLLDQPKKRAQT